MIGSDHLSLPVRGILAHKITAVAILASQQKGKKKRKQNAEVNSIN